MASFKYIVLVLSLHVICIAFAGIIGRKSLADRIAEILPPGGYPGIPERPPIPDIPILKWFTVKPPKPTDPPLSERNQLDLAFIMDTTGSMSPYIENVRQHIRNLVDEIVSSSSTNLRIALIEYRDHRPEDRTFVTRTHDFTTSVSVMKSWLNAARANGGGDGPEAVAEAMYQTTKLSWRANAAKISILIADAPPHGLVPSEDNSFPGGSPNGHDPIDLARKLVGRGIPLYTVGCEDAVTPYKDFFIALAHLTGGQYIPLRNPKFLTTAIVAGAKEELSLKKFSADVKTEMKKAIAAGRSVDEKQIAKSVFNRLKSTGATAQQLVKNNKPLEGATAQAKAIAASKSMAEVRKIFKKRPGTSGSTRLGGRRLSIGGLIPLRESISAISSGVSSGSSKSGAGGSFTAVEKAVSLDQISRLVKQEAAKLAV